ncbi:MAG: amino acid adenylation domain-containing protein, partial [Vicinamibacteria bacterium]
MQKHFDCIHRLFEEQVDRTPRSIAVIEGARRVTYEALNRRANALAHELSRRSVGPGDVVALFADRSVEMVVGVLGILKSGAAYVPLDPGYPKERLEFLVSDSAASLLVVPERMEGRIPSVSCGTLGLPEGEESENPKTRATGEDLAYVIYTSGSTGVPKGVLLPHQGLTSLMTFTQAQMEIGEPDRILQFASFSFDASIWEIFAALITGAALVLGNRDSLLPGPTLARLMKEQRVTVALLSPSVLRMLDPEGLSDLRIMVAGTEKLTSDIVKRWAPGRRFFNAYGPTETTIYSTILEIEDVSEEAPTIGSAVPHTDIYILDDDLRPLPRGESGELAIGGIGVGRGYLNREH